MAGRTFEKSLTLMIRKRVRLVWNYQYGFNSGDSETIYPFWWTFRNMNTGKVERVLKFVIGWVELLTGDDRSQSSTITI